MRDKLDVFNEIMERHGTVMVHLDPRKEDVDVPAWFKEEGSLLLSFVWAHRSPEFCANDWGLIEILRFQGSWHRCYIPWPAVYALGLGKEATLWAQDCPPEILRDIFAQLIKPAEAPAPKPPPSQGRHLKLVKEE